jgi:hypothetical protein
LSSPPGSARFLRWAEPWQDPKELDREHAHIISMVCSQLDAELEGLGLPPGDQAQHTFMLLPDWKHAEYLHESGLGENAPAIVRARDGTVVCNTERLAREGEVWSPESRAALKMAIVANALQREASIDEDLPIRSAVNGPLLDPAEVRRDLADRLYRFLLPSGASTLEGADALQQQTFERLCKHSYFYDGDFGDNPELDRQGLPAAAAADIGLKRIGDSPDLDRSSLSWMAYLNNHPHAVNDLARNQKFRVWALAHTAAVYSELLQERLGDHLPADTRVSDRLTGFVYSKPRMLFVMAVPSRDGNRPILVNYMWPVMRLLTGKSPDAGHRALFHELVHLATRLDAHASIENVARFYQQQGGNLLPECAQAMTTHEVFELLTDSLAKEVLGTPFSSSYEAVEPIYSALTDKDSITRFLSRPPASDESVVAAFKHILAACNEAWGR